MAARILGTLLLTVLAALVPVAIGIWVGVLWVWFVVAAGIVWVARAADRFVRADTVRAASQLAEWDHAQAEDAKIPSGPWDTDQVMVSGWRRRGGPRRLERWIGEHPERMVVWGSALVLGPVVVLAVVAAVMVDGVHRWLPALYVPALLPVIGASRRRARLTEAALEQWDAQQMADSGNDGRVGSSGD